MFDPEFLDEPEEKEADLPPELEAFAEALPAPAPESEFLNDVTQIYLNEIGLNPLLTATEEAALARRVRLGDFESPPDHDRAQPAAGREYCQALSESGDSAAGSGRRGQSWPDACAGKNSTLSVASGFRPMQHGGFVRTSSAQS